MGEALLGVVAEAGEEVAEQQRPDHVDREGRPGPLPRPVRRRLGQPDPDQRPGHAAGVDRRQLARVVGRGAHRAAVSRPRRLAAGERRCESCERRWPERWRSTGRGCVPQVAAELGAWREVAAAIPDPARSADALGSIDGKGLNVEATAVFATLAPRPHPARRRSRAMVALQVAIDYLDTVERAGRPRATPTTSTGSSAPTAAAPAALPPHRAVAATARARRRPLRRRPGATRTRPSTATAPRSRPGRAPRSAPPVYRWWEVAAGASSSVAAHALIAAAADPRTDRRRSGADRRRLLPPDRRPHRPPRRPDRPRRGRAPPAPTTT